MKEKTLNMTFYAITSGLIFGSCTAGVIVITKQLSKIIQLLESLK